MSETIKTCLLGDPDASIPMDRDEFYTEQIAAYKETGAPTRACDIIGIFIFNSDGQMLLQKRSHDKFHNPGLIDKAVGGHVQYEDTVNHTVMVETVQELQTPSIVLNTQPDLLKTLTVLNDYLETIAVVRHTNSEVHQLKRMIDGEEITIASRVHLFFGVYDGRIKPADKEAQGVLFYTMEELATEMKQFPDLFTHDMHYFMELCNDDIASFIANIKK